MLKRGERGGTSLRGLNYLIVNFLWMIFITVLVYHYMSALNYGFPIFIILIILILFLILIIYNVRVLERKK